MFQEDRREKKSLGVSRLEKVRRNDRLRVRLKGKRKRMLASSMFELLLDGGSKPNRMGSTRRWSKRFCDGRLYRNVKSWIIFEYLRTKVECRFIALTNKTY